MQREQEKEEKKDCASAHPPYATLKAVGALRRSTNTQIDRNAINIISLTDRQLQMQRQLATATCDASEAVTCSTGYAALKSELLPLVAGGGE